MLHFNQYLNALASTNLFSCFSKTELVKTFGLAHYEIRKYDKNQVVHLQNEICEYMDVILEGRVAVQKLGKEGHVLTIDVFSAPDILGAHLIFSSNNRYPMTIVAETNTVLLRLSKELILKLGQQNMSFVVVLLGLISDRILILADKIDTISYKTIRQKIIAVLTYECHIQKSRTIKLSYSKKELAERLGIQRTSLSRELNKMRQEGLLDYDARAITIKSIELEKD